MRPCSCCGDQDNAEQPDEYRYRRFCDVFRNWEGRLPPVMRQHNGGDEMVLTVRRARCVTRTSSSRTWPHPACRSRCDVDLAARHWIAGTITPPTAFLRRDATAGDRQRQGRADQPQLQRYGATLRHHDFPARPRRPRDRRRSKAASGSSSTGCWGGCATKLFAARPNSKVRPLNG